MFAMQGLGSFPVSLAGSNEIKQRLLPKVKSGDAIAAFAITEPEAGSDVSALQTTARRDGASYVLDGEKTFISNAGLADFYTVFAKTDAEKGSKGPRPNGKWQIANSKSPIFYLRFAIFNLLF